MIKEKFGARLDGWIHRLFPFLFRRSLDPNTLTVVGTLVALVASAALASGAFVAGGLLLLAGGFFDLVDGVVARHHGTSTSFGAFLDSTLDRLVDMAVLLGLIAHYGASGDQWTVAVASVVLMATVLTSYAKARAEQSLSELKGGLLERGERIVLIAAAAIFDLMVPALWLLAAGTTWTVAQRFAVAYRGMQALDAEAGGAGEPT